MSWKLGKERDVNMKNLLERTQAYLSVKNEIELSDEQVRVAMSRLVLHFRILASWDSEDEKQPSSSALSPRRGGYENVS